MNRKRFGGDPVEALRRADPLDRLEVQAEAAEAHKRALFQEITDMDTTERPTPAPARGTGFRIAVTAAAVTAVAAAAIGGYALFADKADPRIIGGEAIGGGGMAMCIQYDDSILAGQQQAFDGTVASIDGTRVTFAVRHWYKGGEGDSVTLDAEGLTGGPNSAAMDGSLPLEPGQRYLASANDGVLWSCGYTLTFDSDLADHWAQLFGA
ncbi:MAG: hypothetical protein A2Z12_07960 [Actinobacteria bacterium RBG_16_68_21]|nr:MAG: hypothetical protein A2Z12_07960 [Actinobacteria bacterium RBG_16_68_21]